MTDTQREVIVAVLGVGNSQRAAARAAGVSHTSVSRLLERSPELRKQVAAYQRREARREKKRLAAAARRAAAAVGTTQDSSMAPERTFGLPNDRYAHRTPGEKPPGATPGGARGRRVPTSRGGGRVMVDLMPDLNGGRTGRDAGGKLCPDWWLDTKDAQRDLHEVRLRDSDGRELDYRVVPVEIARELIALHGYEAL